ncbi:MAG: hypothetical protein ACE5G7_00020 [Candidatus Hydrothermarchaeaceae archaeon]
MAMKNELKALHALAAISIVGGLLRVFALLDGDVMTKNIVMSQYVLWAILFEIVALNIKD